MSSELKGALVCFINGVPDACLVVDERSVIVLANVKAEMMFQRPRERLIAMSVTSLISERSRECYSRLQSSIVSSCQRSSEEKTLYALRADGSEFPVEMFMSPFEWQSGLVGILNVRDCTKRTQVERELDRVHRALHELERQQCLLFESIPLPMWVSDPETSAFLAVNESAIRHYGFSRSEFLAMNTGEVGNHERNAPRQRVQEHRKKDGTIIQVELAISNVYFQGKAARLVVVHDVTQQNRDQSRLRQSEERFAKAFRSSPVAITISTLSEGRYLDVNDAFLKIMGQPREAVIGRTVRELGVWVEAEERADMVEQLSRAGNAKILSCKFRAKSGEGRLTNVFAERVEFDGVPCVLAITQDITEAHRLEEQLRQSQKMEAVGRLASGVAHEFSNMLSVILGYTELLAERNLSNSTGKGIEEIRKAAERAVSLTRQLLVFSRHQVLQPRTIKVNDAVENATKLLFPLLGEDIEFLMNLDPDAGLVRADAVQIEQVLLNLAINARDAMPHGGRLVIETGNIDLDANFSSAAGLPPGPYVMLSVSDNGCGMDAATLAHIFEPFFTTKSPGEGTGLGLALVYGCVKQNGGHIWVTSQPRKGTCFKVYFPRIEDETPPQKDPEVTDAKGGSETVLVVEDDDSLRLLTAKILEANGYVTLQAGDGRQAIELAKNYSGPIDLLLTDVVMPGLGGAELAALISAFRPELKLLYVSGYPNDLIACHGALEPPVALLEKPFTTRDLLRQVRSVLNDPASPETADV